MKVRERCKAEEGSMGEGSEGCMCYGQEINRDEWHKCHNNYRATTMTLYCAILET